MLLKLNRIQKNYMQGKMDVPVLNNISLSVASGEYVAIMGPSGSGKTTLMNIIGCLDYPTDGEYLLDGEDIMKFNDTQLSDIRLHSIGFVFQNFYLLPRQSALENVALPLTYAGIKKPERLNIAREALTRVGLADRTDFKPTQLSGGQCQRVAIARAMVNNPKILLADEPTGALDTASGKQIMELFQRLNDEGVTILMITHEQMVANHAKTIYHIRDGRFVDEGGNFVAPKAEPIFRPIQDAPMPVNKIANEHVSNITAQYPSPAVKPKHSAPATRYKKPEPRKKPADSTPERSAAAKLPPPHAKPVSQAAHKPEKQAKSTISASNVKPSKTTSGRQPVSSERRSAGYPKPKIARPAEPPLSIRRGDRAVSPIYATGGAAPTASKPVSDPRHGQFKNPIKTEIQFDPSSWGTDLDEEEF